jgi:hypothetical protein
VSAGAAALCTSTRWSEFVARAPGACAVKISSPPEPPHPVPDRGDSLTYSVLPASLSIGPAAEG